LKTIEECRKELENDYRKWSEEEIQQLWNFLQTLSDIAIETYYENEHTNHSSGRHHEPRK